MQAEKLLLDNSLFLEECLKLLSEGESVTLRASGDSMFPFIANGRDQVVLHRLGRIAAGDIVLVRLHSKGYILHRIYQIEGERLALMGDSNLQAVEQCRKDEVLATVVRIIRNGRAIDCSSRPERFRATVWRLLLPVRRELLFICRRLMRRQTAKTTGNP